MDKKEALELEGDEQLGPFVEDTLRPFWDRTWRGALVFTGLDGAEYRLKVRDKHTLLKNKKIYSTKPSALRLLELLAAAHLAPDPDRQSIHRETLYQGTWGNIAEKASEADGIKKFKNSVDQEVKELRNDILGDKRDKDHWHIIDVEAGWGYKFLLPVTAEPDSVPAKHIDLRPYCGKWHYYHNTRDRNGEFWSYAVLDFLPCKDTDTKLVTRAVSLPDTPWKDSPGPEWTDDRIKHYKDDNRYQFEASLVDEHLVIQTTKVDGRSDMSVKIFRDPRAHLKKPIAALMLVTDTWAGPPAVVMVMMQKGERLQSDNDEAGNIVLQHAVDGEPIRDPVAIRTLSNEWARWSEAGTACLVPHTTRAFQREDIVCHWVGSDEKGREYTASQRYRTRAIRDVHVRSERGGRFEKSGYSQRVQELANFLRRRDTQITLVAGDIVDKEYIGMFISALELAVQERGDDDDELDNIKNKIICYRIRNSDAELTNFIILDYDEGDQEVLFGWEKHLRRTSGKVFRSDHERVVREFDASFKNLRRMSVPVDLRSLLLDQIDLPTTARGHALASGFNEKWEKDKVEAMLRQSAPDAEIKILITFFIDETPLFDLLDELLLNSKRKMEIIMMSPNDDNRLLLERRYGDNRRELRVNFTWESAKSQIVTQLEDFRRYQKKLAKARIEHGSLVIRTHDTVPTVVSYQIGDQMLIGMLLTRKAFDQGPMITVHEGERRLWEVFKENYEACKENSEEYKGR